MPSRADLLCVPESPFERAEWASAHWIDLIRSAPLSRAREGWAVVADLEAELFPAPNVVPLDPACPECGVETEEGTIELEGDAYRVSYGCGHVFLMTTEQIHARYA